MERVSMEEVFKAGFMCNTEQADLIKASIHKLYRGGVVKAMDWLCDPNPLFFGVSPHEAVNYLGKGDLVLSKINEFLGKENEIEDVEAYWKSVAKD